MFEVTCNEENAKTIDVAGVAECISAVKINIFHCLPHKVSLTDTVRSQLLISSGSEGGKKKLWNKCFQTHEWEYNLNEQVLQQSL